MSAFMIRFLICNVFISVIIGSLLTVKWLFRNKLTSRMQYHVWFLFIGLLVIPFIPAKPIHIFSFFCFEIFNPAALQNTSSPLRETATITSSTSTNWMQDFTLNINRGNYSTIGQVLFFIWMIGILIMIVFAVKSLLRLNTIKKSALPLQNKKVYQLYNNCLDEMNITKTIPIYSTAFLKSPILVGFVKPCIYLPIHLISYYNSTDMRYMLLHELQHYKHKDTLVNILMNLTGILYWFHPFVWFALTEMRNDREVACDSAVLNMLKKEDYEDYGNTLINVAEKVSLTPFPFSTGISGTMKQMKRRITNIAYYKKPTIRKRLKSSFAFGLIAILMLSLTPALSTYATDETHYHWNTSLTNVSCTDLSTYFEKYDGSFVLYDLKNDAWQIYNWEQATLQVSPDSTYKIYSALFGLEEGVITPKNSLIAWDKKNYPFKTWNKNHTLSSAMDASVNWYFQALEEQLGSSTVSDYIQKIGYGNQDMSGDFSSYWMESTLKISPVEQVELLTKLYNNSFGFSPKNINAVKEAICLSSSKKQTLYGKTGSGRINGNDVNGWFIGYVEKAEHTYFFAVNIAAENNATGSNASEIALTILSDMNIIE